MRALAGDGRVVPAGGRAGHRQERAGRPGGRAPVDAARQGTWGRGWETGGAPAYWPWVQGAAHVRGARPLTTRSGPSSERGSRTSHGSCPELHELFPDLPEPPVLESDAARFRLFDAVGLVPGGRPRCSRPLVLVLDDLHAADAPLALLLQSSSVTCGGRRLLVVGAFRDVELESAIRCSAMAELAARRLPACSCAA